MSRRRADSKFARILLLLAGVTILIFHKELLSLLVSILAYCGLPGLVAAYVYSKEERVQSACSPGRGVPSATEYDWTTQRAEIQKLAFEHKNALQKLFQMYQDGKERGIRQTAASNHFQFDERNRHGAMLNRMIEKYSTIASQKEQTIEACKRSTLKSLPNWRLFRDTAMEDDIWWTSTLWGLSAFFLSIVALALKYPAWVASLSDNAMLVVPTLRSLYGPAAAATVAGLATIVIARKLVSEHLNASFMSEAANAWLRLESDIKGSDSIPDDYVPPASKRDHDDNHGRTERRESPVSGKSTWFDILGVSESASPNEIRNAWRKRIREYHPDSVATRGTKLKELAERESTIINVAFKEARRLGKV